MLPISEKIRQQSPLIFQWLLFLLVVICLLLTICAGFEGLWWRAYIVAQLRVQIAAASGLLALVLVAVKERRHYAAIPALIALVNSVYFMPVYVPRNNHIAGGGRTLRVLQINLNNKNLNHSAVIGYVRSISPDILVVTELTEAWREALSGKLADYQHTSFVPRQDTYGIGVFSLVEFKNSKIQYYGKSGHPSIVCELRGSQNPITLIHTHVQGPVKQAFFEWHKEQILLMTEEFKQIETPLVVTGDMNCTPWTYLSADLLRKCNLSDSRNGFGLQLSWPAPFSWRMCPIVLLPIDNCFVSPQISVRKRVVGPFVGSDHYPVFVELEIPN